MRYLSSFLMIISLSMLAVAAQAETKIGYVQIQKIMQSPQFLDTGKKLQEEFKPRQDELNRFRKQVEDKDAALAKQQATLAESERKKRASELDDIKLELARKQRALSEDFDIRQKEEKSKLQDRINKAVTSVSQAEGYDLVLYGTAAYAGKNVDITDKVIKALK